MGTSQNIGNLNVTVTADASALVNAFNVATDVVSFAAEKMDKAVQSMGTGMEANFLKVIAGARAFSAIHREIMHVIENIDKIPGMPPQVIQSVTEAREEFSNFRAQIDIVIGKLVAFGADFGHSLGAGIAMLAGASADDVANGLGEHRSGRQMMDDEAASKDLGYHEKIIAAEHQLAEAKQLVNIKDGDRVHQINTLIDLAARLEVHSKSNSITTLAAIKDETEANKDLAKSAALTQGIYKEIFRNNAETAKLEQEMALASETHVDKFKDLAAQLRDVHELMGNLEKGPVTPDRLAALADAGKKQNDIIKESIPLLKEHQRVWDQMGDKMSNTVQGMIVNGSSLRDTWHTLLKDMEADLVKSLLGDQLKSIFSNLMKGLFGGAGGGAGGGLMTSIVGMFMGHAGGGNMDGPSIVGENGPELFVPSGSGLVLNNDTTRGLTGKGRGGDVYHIDARGADQSAIARLEATVKQLNGSIESRAINANLSYNRRVTPSYNPGI